jgi:hypothetical protein
MKYFQYKAGSPIMVSEPKDMKSRKKSWSHSAGLISMQTSVEQNPGTSIGFFQKMKNQSKKP